MKASEMGSQFDSHERFHMPGMPAIERKIAEMARKKGMAVTDCRWKAGDRRTHATPLRLDVSIGNRTEKIYFTERELAHCAHEHIADDTLVRLYRVISRIHEEQLPFAISSLKDVLSRVRP